MKFYDIFNGDADGICALHQLRLSVPRNAELVTGTKRDIALLKTVHPEAGDRVTVLDVSLDANRSELLAMLERGASVSYFDHHFAGDIPNHRHFVSYIDTSAEICTSLIVDRHLGGAHRKWAVAAAFGDNLHRPALAAASGLGLGQTQIGALRELGECLNYNAYGLDLSDLHFHPADLYRRLQPFADPLAFHASSPEITVLRNAMAEDLTRARQLPLQDKGGKTMAVILPDTTWARRIAGIYANEITRAHPEETIALLSDGPNGYRVSLRGPDGARLLRVARAFDTGGGRQRAAGISLLPKRALPELWALLAQETATGPIDKMQ